MSSTSAVSGSAGQTMITFLTETSSALGPVSQQRVFNYQITSDAQTYYEQEMAIIQYALLDGTSPPINGVAAPLDTSGTGGNLNEAIVQTVQAAMQALNTWSQYQYVDSNGVQHTDASTLPSVLSANPSTMTSYMAQGLDTLISTMTAAGFNPLLPTTDPTYSEAAMENAVTSIQADDVSSTPIYKTRSVLGTAIAAAANAVIIGKSSTESQSIQQLLMVDYVESGNQILFNQMDQLQSAVNLNQNILSYLNSLQDLMNQKTPQDFLLQLQNLNSASPNYSQFESSTYGNQILGTTPQFTEAQLANYISILNIQNAGGNPNDPVTMQQNGLISSNAQLASLYQELTGTGSYSSTTPAIPLVPALPQSLITQYNFTTYDTNLYHQMALAQLAGADPTNLFTQVKYGITTYESAINTIINNLSAYGITPGYGETNLDALFDGSSASNAVLTQLGIPTSSYDPTNAYIKQECQSYLSWCSSYGIDPSDTNIASMFDAKHLVDACSQLQDAGKDPTSLSVQAAAGIPTQESSKIQTIMQTCTNKGWTTVDQMEADISSGDWGLLQQMGLTNQTSWQGAPGGPQDSYLVNLFIFGQGQGTVPTPSTTLSPAIMTQYGLTAYDQQVYAAFAVAAAKGVDPLTYITSQGLTFPSSQTSPNPFPAGTTNINVLLYLQKAGLDPTTAAVQQEYSLSAQDIADYNIILQVQAQYPPPNTPDFTDPTVQAQYDLVSTPISSETAAAGTAPNAFVDLVSGLFNAKGSGFQDIIDNLEALITQAKAQVGASAGASVVSELTQVLADFTNAGSVSAWVQNFTNQNEGTYQSDLNNAVTASQALNDTEREQLQQVMFVYQEFYQSAMSILSSINTLLQTMATNISSQ